MAEAWCAAVATRGLSDQFSLTNNRPKGTLSLLLSRRHGVRAALLCRAFATVEVSTSYLVEVQLSLHALAVSSW